MSGDISDAPKKNKKIQIFKKRHQPKDKAYTRSWMTDKWEMDQVFG